MTLTRLTTLSLLTVLALAACSREKVQPADGASADSALSPEQREIKKAEQYKVRQAAFADSVLKTSNSTKQIAAKLGDNYGVGTVQMRDSLVKWVERTPKCYKDAKGVDPYLAGTVTFRIHMSVVGSDNVRVQESSWTSPAGSIADRCFNEEATKWKFPMGMGKPGYHLLQIQFK